MKKNLNPKKLLSCALLMLGGISSLHAATLTVKVKNSSTAPLAGVTVKVVPTTGSVISGITDVNGEFSTNSLADNISYKVIATYNSTSYEMPESAINYGTNTNVEDFQTSELKVVTESGGVGAAGIGIEYMNGYPQGSWISAGLTNAQGILSVQVFPFNNMNIRVKGNGPVETRTITSFPYQSICKTASFNNLVKVQSPGATFQIGGSWLAGNGIYAFPGTYPGRVNNENNCVSSVKLEGSLFNKVAVLIQVKDHDGNAIKGATIRGGYGNIPNGGGFGWHCNPTNDKGMTIDWTEPGDKIRSYEASVNGTTAAQSKDITQYYTNVFTFKSSELTLKLQDCTGKGITGGSARYGIGTDYFYWFVPGANNTNNDGITNTIDDGITRMEAFPGTYSFEMGINQSTQVKQIVFNGTNGLTWTTTKVAFNWPYDVAYGGAGGNAYFPNKAGTEMLPGTVNFSFRNNGENVMPITIPVSTPGNCVTFEKTPIIGRLLNSSNAPLAGGNAEFFQGSWQDFHSATQANGNAVALLNGNPATATVTMEYLGSAQQQSYVVLAAVGNVIKFNTSVATMSLVDAGNHPIEGNTLEYHAGGWKKFGSGNTTLGVETMELLAGTYSFAMKLNGTRQQISNHDLGKTPTVAFQASKVTLKLVDGTNDNAPIQKGAASYYVGVWKSLGLTDADGLSQTVDMLPGSHIFKMVKGPFSEQKNAVVINQLEQTIPFVNTVPNNARMTKPGAATEQFSFYPNPAISNLHVRMPAAGTVEILSIDGKKLAQHEVAEGTTTIDVSSIPTGNYVMIINYNGQTETHKFIKN